MATAINCARRHETTLILGLALGFTLLAAQTSRAAEPEKIDCHGGPITISGDHRTVELANCTVVRVEGSHDVVKGRLPRQAKVYVTGNHNQVDLQPPEGVSFSHLKDTGHDNRLGGPN